jgi:hypothetical protein
MLAVWACPVPLAKFEATSPEVGSISLSNYQVAIDLELAVTDNTYTAIFKPYRNVWGSIVI